MPSPQPRRERSRAKEASLSQNSKIDSKSPQVSKFDDLHDAALSVVAESYRLWLQ